MIAGGLFWTATYLLVIRHGFKEKTFGMPFAALCANISWETIFTFIHPHSSPQIYINYLRFFLYAVIVFQFLKYGKREFPKFSKTQFYLVFVLGISVAFPMIYSINLEFDDWSGAYAAFGQNLMMSVLFISMLLSRNDLRGQSIYIGVFKMLGTGAASLAFYLYRSIAQDSMLFLVLFIGIFVFDIIYVIMLYKKHKELGITLWKRI
jgi:hypothetical protein